MKKLFISLVTFLCVSMFLFAGGNKEAEERPLEELESWQESFDISEKKAGKYNIVITTEDKGGNITLGGPYNIFIDPESDLPISGITNPRNEMRVPGNLNIVGTCIDDDAVGRVEIILDGDLEHPIVAEGKDFWSYYLDTTKMAEGVHTISVYGIDDKGVQGHANTVKWHLDRRQPESLVENHAMGDLVSGKVKLEGRVDDGNGIVFLSYSLDNGVTFQDVKITENKKEKTWNFGLTIDTTKMEDGASVCWFRAVDKQGTSGLYSYMYFIDNTKPDVAIVSPLVEQEVNGRFIVAGYAKDVIGIKELSWAFADNTGLFELVPGNPYWTLDLDVSELGNKAQELQISALDTVGNTTLVKQKILVNPLLDLATIELQTPTENQVIYDEFFIRGRVKDDDGVAELHYTIDNGEEINIPCEGVFYDETWKKLPEGLKTGNHTAKLWAVDIHGKTGAEIIIPFIYAGEAPIYENLVVTSGAKTEEPITYVAGMEVHPEAQKVFNATITSECGLQTLSWKFPGKDAETRDLEGVKGKYDLSIPLSDLGWGITNLVVTATDIYGRKTQQLLNFNITNLSKTRGKIGVVFDDSTISETGIIDFSEIKTVSGYFVGDKASSVSLEPETNFASVKLSGNSIIISAKSGKGLSEKVKVRVVTEKGITYESRNLQFKTKIKAPTVKISGKKIYDGSSTVTINGSVTTDVDLRKVSYRILNTTEQGSWMPVTAKDGTFTIKCSSTAFVTGVSVIEIQAEDTADNITTEAVFARNILPPEVPEDGKKVTIAKPVISWIDGVNVYYVTTYAATLKSAQVIVAGADATGSFDPIGGEIKRDILAAGDTALEVKVTDDADKIISAKYTAKKDGIAKISIASVNDKNYLSGMECFIPLVAPKDQKDNLIAKIESDFAISAVIYDINGTIQGKATVVKTEDPRLFDVQIPLNSIPAEISKITITAEIAKGNPISCSGTISVLREKPSYGVIDNETVYWQDKRDNETNEYILEAKDEVLGYANFKTPFKAEIEGGSEDVTVSVSGNIVSVKALKSGKFENIVVKITDAENIEFTASPINIISDSKEPSVTLLEPANNKWIQNAMSIKANVSEDSTLAKVEYSLDNGASWVDLEADENGQFVKDLDMTVVSDGMIPLIVKATDIAGKSSEQRRAIHKDTKAPTVQVIVPEDGNIVNGETSIAFYVTDEGKLVTAEYINMSEPVLAEDGTVTTPSAEVSRKKLELKPFITTIVGIKDTPINNEMPFAFTDASGNTTLVNTWKFKVDAESDLPVAEIHIPSKNEIIQTDFVISGVIYDDDGECKIWYKIDDNEYQSLPKYGSSYSIDVPLSAMTDNEHTVTVFAEDIHGVKGPEYVQPFRVSLEEPKGAVVLPEIVTTVKNRIQVSGWASDKNGISKVEISVDNGNTYNNVVGTEEWSYEFDTNVIEDGTHVVFIKVWDGYEIQALYSSLINIDNTVPDITLELPIDGSKTTGILSFSGQTTDNIGLTKLYANIRALDDFVTNEDGTTSPIVIPENLSYMDFVPAEIITTGIDISQLMNGRYNIELTGEDAGGNITRVSRNIELNKNTDPAKIDVLYPLNGEHVFGQFNLSGKVTSEKPIQTVNLYINDKQAATAEVTLSGYFMFKLEAEVLATGNHNMVVKGMVDGNVVSSDNLNVIYNQYGPWISIDNFTMGDFAMDRPFIRGNAGYTITEEEEIAVKAKETLKEAKTAIQQKKVARIEISLDNGKSFTELSKKGQFKYRIENGDMREGYHYMIIRAIMENGELAVTRTIVQIDKQPPKVKIISPEEGGRFNEKIEFSGLASDDVALKNVTLALRSGDKASYEIPAFIQGLYIDVHAWGLTMYDVGLGLTFFDDNVRLQGQFGQMTEEMFNIAKQLTGNTSAEGYRFGGNVVGAKLLANIGSIPFRYFFGPDWEWLSANFTLGANFSWCSDSGSGTSKMISAVLGQVEFPRITFPKQKMFGTLSFYTEGQIWFCPTDVESTEEQPLDPVVWNIGFGIRANVF